MVNNQKNHKHIDDYSEEEQHLKRKEHYIPPKNWLSKFCKKTGFADKTLWDFIQLVGPSFVLAVLGLYVSWSVENTQRDIETNQYQQKALENYITEMTTFIVEHDIFGVGFPKKEKDRQSDKTPFQRSDILTKELKSIAKAKTLTTLLLLKLDRDRRDLLLYFLREADLCCITIPKSSNEVHLLQGIRLPGANLREADLTDANLSQAHLEFADLRDAKLAGANLTKANLHGTDLRNTQLNKAYLKATFAAHANLEGANLEGANLEEATLDQANLKGAKLTSSADPPGKPIKTNLSNAKLRGASLQGAKLQKANLYKANLGLPSLPPDDQKDLPKEEKKLFRSTTDLREADLREADLREADLTGADLREADLTGAKGGRASDLSEAKLCNTTMEDGNVSNRNCWWNRLLFWRKSPH
ncbi:pentapeptide repeat-containing protein [Nostoc sp. NZL]|uniref:pentapeptide repeat-containing protein n=1 Tax=Nostoc sp. NZL TaxID=2650612 RepID=UPI0018C84007|nr:pentapeptide repeat-containing protein [Nostoc sp. NZL]MBG1243346.1 pentapeptide repeat-containing protein [Nostoc sp. NZL]